MKTITVKKLFHILKLVNAIGYSRWNDVIKLREILAKCEIVEKKWGDKFKQDNPQFYPLDLYNEKMWSTYEKCVDIKYYISDDEKLICDVRLYDGNLLDGSRTKLKFTAKIILPNDFIKELEDKILYKLEILAQDSYEEYLENKRRTWISNFKNDILNK